MSRKKLVDKSAYSVEEILAMRGIYLGQPLSLRDLLSAESNGFGYLGHSVRRPEFWVSKGLSGEEAYQLVEAIDTAVVRQAEAAKWDVEQLHAFADSKAGRHMGDVVCSAKSITDAVGAVESFLADPKACKF